MQENKPKNKTTSAKANEENKTTNNIIGALSGLSSMQSGKTGAERAVGMAKTYAGIAGLLDTAFTGVET